MSTSPTAPSPAPRGPLPASRSWRHESKFGKVRARWFVSRVLLVVTVLAFIGYFAFSLVRPFEHARPILVLMGEPIRGEAIPERSLIPVPLAGYVRRDFDAFAPLAAVTGEDSKDGPARLAAPATNDGLDRLRRELARADGHGSVAILYVSGYGVSVDGQPVMYWNRLDDGLPTQTDVGRLLDVVSSSPARSKLLLIDAGDIRALPEQGMLVNGFVQLLEDAVDQRNDRSLWVLVSHSMLEVSHLCHAERRSIFGSTIVEGLAGAADANDDRAVDLAELYEFTARTVGRRVDELTLGLESQTPALLWSGGELASATPPVLVPVDTGTGKQKPSDSQDSNDTGSTPPSGGEQTSKEAQSGSTDSGTSKPSATAPAGNASGATTQPPADASNPPSPSATTSAPAATPAATRSTGSATPASSPPAPQPNGAAANAGTGPGKGPTATPADNPPAASPLESFGVAGIGSAVEDLNATDPATKVSIEKTLAKLDRTSRKLYETWALRDRLLERRGPMWRTAADTNPGAWRGLENTLVMYEWRVRRGQDTPAAMQGALDRIADEFRELDRRSRSFEPIANPGTLGMLQLWTLPNDPRRTVLAPFDAAIESPNDAAVKKLLAKPPSGTADLAELGLARDLLGTSAAWEDVADALRVRRRFELLVAAAGTFRAWIDEDAHAIAARLASAERTLLDGVDPARDRPVVEGMLREARRRLRIAESRLVTLQRAEQVRNDAALRLADDVDWTFRVAAVVPDEDDWHRRPREIVKAMQHLWMLMQTPRAELVDDVARATAQLAGLRRDVESNTSPAYVVALVESDRGVALGFLEALLTNPSCGADVRLLADRALHDVDTDGRPGHLRHLAWTARLPPILLAGRWQPYVRLAEEELSSQRLEHVLAGIPEGDGELVRANRRRIEQLRIGIESNVVEDAHRDRVRRIFRQLGREIAVNYRTRPSGLPVWAAFRSMTPASGDGPSPIWRDDLTDTLRLRTAILRSDVQGADAEESSAIGSDLGTIGDEFATLVGRRSSSVALSVRLRAATAVAFVTPTDAESAPRAVVKLRLDWNGKDGEPAWVAVDAVAGTRVFSESTVRIETPASLSVAPADHVALRRELRKQSPSLELRDDQPTDVAVGLAGDGRVPPHGRVVVHLVTRDTALRIPITLPASSAPPIAIRAGGVDRSFSFDDDQAVLHPFPNRSTAYQLFAAVTDGRARTVSAELYAPRNAPVPTRRIATSLADARNLLDRLGATAPVAQQPKLELPADGSQVAIAWAPPKNPPPAGAASASGAAPDSAGAKAGTPIGGRLLLVLRDAKDARAEIVPIRIAPQQPRRYTQARAEYDAATRTARITVDVPEPSAAPSGVVPIRAQFRSTDKPGSATRRPVVVESALRGGDRLATLSIGLPQETKGRSRLFVEVDGWPRAFQFTVDPARSDGTLPETRDVLQARIVEPAAGKAYPGSVRTIPVGVHADLPQLTGPDTTGRVVVGLDLNGDRELDGEPRVIVTSDRQVTPAASVASDGRLVIAVKVTDLVLPVPVPPGTNTRAGLLALVESGVASAWSRSVPVVVDGQPPRVLAFDLATRPPIVLGEPVTAIATATDDGLSGVAKVEVAFDTSGTGEFPKKGPVLTGVRDPEGLWRVTIPTKSIEPGQHVLLVRATDLVGNVSTVRRLTVTAVTKAEREKTLAETTRIVRGQVTYLGDPVPGASVVIRPAVAKPTDDPKPLEATTGADGTFEFPKVKPGSVQVTAEAVVRDRRRKDSKTVEVPTIPEDPPFVSLELPYARKP